MRGLRPRPNERSTAEPCSAGQPGAAVPTWFVGSARVFFSALREIFDESAYSRFLSRREMISCPGAYAAFLREQEGTKARRPKCC
jgi:hypothetical protein